MPQHVDSPSSTVLPFNAQGLDMLDLPSTDIAPAAHPSPSSHKNSMDLKPLHATLSSSKKRTSTADPSPRPRKSRKPAKQWHRDYGINGRHALDILISWMAQDSFQARWGGKGGISRADMIHEFNGMLREAGVQDERNRTQVEDKMRHIEGDFKKAMDWKREAEAGLTGDSEAKERSLHDALESLCYGFHDLLPSLGAAARVDAGILFDTSGNMYDEGLELLRAELDLADDVDDDEEPGIDPSSSTNAGRRLKDPPQIGDGVDRLASPVRDISLSLPPSASQSHRRARATEDGPTRSPTPATTNGHPVSVAKSKKKVNRSASVVEVMKVYYAERIALQREQWEAEIQLGRDRLALDIRRFEFERERGHMEAKVIWWKTKRELVGLGWTVKDIEAFVGTFS